MLEDLCSERHCGAVENVLQKDEQHSTTLVACDIIALDDPTVLRAVNIGVRGGGLLVRGVRSFGGGFHPGRCGCVVERGM